MPSRGDYAAALLLTIQVIGCSGGERTDFNQPSSRAVRTGRGENGASETRTHPRGTVVATAPISGRPFGIALSRNGIVYCTLLDAASLVRTTLVPDSLTTIPVAAVPTDVDFSPDGNWAYVTNQRARAIGIVDTRTNTQVGTISLEADPFRVLVGPEGQRVYATTNRGDLVQIESETRTVAWTIPLGGNLNGLAINRVGTRVYVGDVGGKVYEVDVAGNVIRVLNVPGQPQGLVLSSEGTELYAAGEGGDLVVVNLVRGAEVARVSLGAGGFGIAVTPDQAQIWVTAPHTGQVFVLDRMSRSIVTTIAVGGIPRRLAFDRFGATAVIADETGTIRFVQ